MELFDVAIVGGGPAGSSCAAFCALAGLRTVVLEREKFPREKVCGDCLNPSRSVDEKLLSIFHLAKRARSQSNAACLTRCCYRGRGSSARKFTKRQL